MNHFEVYFNTHAAHYQGIAAWIGDWGLAPVRYLFNGRDVAILGPDEVHHVASFHVKGKENRSNTCFMWSEPKSTKRTILAIVLLIPGLVLSIFKLVSYLFAEIREKHQIILDHFSPLKEGAIEKPCKHDFRTPLEIGTVEEPITTTKQLERELTRSRLLPSGGHVDALIIHGNGKLKIVTDPGVFAIDPLRLILDGAELEHPVSDKPTLDTLMANSEEWEISPVRMPTEADPICPNDGIKRVATVQDALAAVAPRKRGAICSCERYRQVFVVPRLTA